MRIKCSDTGKRFNRTWIFRHFNFEFISGLHYAITGPNGSGKSTLLQVIAGATMPSEGSARYFLAPGHPASAVAGSGSIPEKEQESDSVYQLIAIAAPYLDLIEEMNLEEFLTFHQSFKPLLPGITCQDIITIMGLQAAAKKQIRYYSSGMKQRVKLAQAIFSDTPCLFLDEPCTNLDDAGVQQYHQLIQDYGGQRLIIVSSNDSREYEFCHRIFNMLEYK